MDKHPINTGENNFTRSKSGYELKAEHVGKFNGDSNVLNTVSTKLNANGPRDELDDLLQVEREWNDRAKLYQTLPNGTLSSQLVMYSK